MKIHKAILIKPADKFMVRVWDRLFPDKENYSLDIYGLEKYLSDYDKWELSYKDFEVHPDYFHKIFDYVYDTFFMPVKYEISIQDFLCNGVELDPDLIDFCCGMPDVNGECCRGLCVPKCGSVYAILKNKPVESEDDLWSDLYEIIENHMGNFSKDILKQLKEKYKLKRK